MRDARCENRKAQRAGASRGKQPPKNSTGRSGEKKQRFLSMPRERLAPEAHSCRPAALPPGRHLRFGCLDRGSLQTGGNPPSPKFVCTGYITEYSVTRYSRVPRPSAFRSGGTENCIMRRTLLHSTCCALCRCLRSSSPTCPHVDSYLYRVWRGLRRQ